MKACVVLDMFKTFIRSGKSVVQLLKMRCFIIKILVFISGLLVALALQCSKIFLVFLGELFVSSCSIFSSPVSLLYGAYGPASCVRRPAPSVRRISPTVLKIISPCCIHIFVMYVGC